VRSDLRDSLLAAAAETPVPREAHCGAVGLVARISRAQREQAGLVKYFDRLGWSEPELHDEWICLAGGSALPERG